MASVSANSSGVKMNEGDWICSDPTCGNINFSRRSSCNRCKKDREKIEVKSLNSKQKLGTEIGKSAAEKSRGLFSADDWQCSKCPNVNWARRQTCNVCNAPKFGEVEARTGYGGGYNERGVVEYRRREHSSDDEYDEFGRKRRKKKRSEHSSSDKGSSQARSSPESGGGGPNTAPAASGSEEEEEESGDEADLAKYDLWGSDGEPPSNDQPRDEAEKECDASPAKSSSSQSKERNGGSKSPADKEASRRSRSSSSSSSSTSSSSSSRESSKAPPRNKYDDFNLNSERSSRESSPARKAGTTGSRVPSSGGSKERRPAAADVPSSRRRDRDSKGGGGDSRSHDHRSSGEHRHRSRDSPYRERRREERSSRGARYNTHATHHYSRARPR